jgi:signal transduction histidine kinase
LREYSTSISNILDLEQLATVSTGLISEAMEIQHGALFVVHSENGENEEGESYFHLRGVRGMGEGEDLIPSALPTDSPLAEYLRQEHSPLTQYDIDLHPRFKNITSSARDWFTDLDMDVYVPIYAKGEWIGLLALGPKRSGDRYFDEELVLLSTLADQTAVALENARLFDDLKARSAEVERLNEDLAVANLELTRMGQAKSDFIDIASHELRTPLTQVRGYTDILSEMIESDSLSAKGGVKLTEGLKKAAERMEEIINTMFDVAQIDTETLSLSLFPESLAAIMKNAVKPWAEALKERKLTLTVEGLAGLPSISADGKRLQQAFSHIIQNAIKFTPDGGQICITGRMLEWTLPQDQSIEIVVADTGIGIAPEELERIFEKFYRVGDALLHSTGKTKFKGAGPGLGLTIARGIVEAHGGRIWAESPGYDEETCPGGEFHIVLPVQPRTSSSVGERVVFLTG